MATLKIPAYSKGFYHLAFVNGYILFAKHVIALNPDTQISRGQMDEAWVTKIEELYDDWDGGDCSDEEKLKKLQMAILKIEYQKNVNSFWEQLKDKQPDLDIESVPIFTTHQFKRATKGFDPFLGFGIGADLINESEEQIPEPSEEYVDKNAFDGSEDGGDGEAAREEEEDQEECEEIVQIRISAQEGREMAEEEDDEDGREFVEKDWVGESDEEEWEDEVGDGGDEGEEEEEGRDRRKAVCWEEEEDQYYDWPEEEEEEEEEELEEDDKEMLDASQQPPSLPLPPHPSQAPKRKRGTQTSTSDSEEEADDNSMTVDSNTTVDNNTSATTTSAVATLPIRPRKKPRFA